MSAQIISLNPAKDYEVLGQVKVSTETEIRAKVEFARFAQKDWCALDLESRIYHMQMFQNYISQHRDTLIKLTSLEMGMPKQLSKDIVDSALNDMIWHCNNAKKYLSNKILFEDDREVNTLRHEPYGVVACIMAWNFPFGNFVQSVSQGLLAGNAFVIKYSEEIPLFSSYLDEVITLSNLPDGIVNFVYGDGSVGNTLIDQDIDFISFTGSSTTGQKLYEKAASKFIPASLELGGSSPGVVFEDCLVDEELIEKIFEVDFRTRHNFATV